MVKVNSFKWRTGQWEVVLDTVTGERFEGYVYDKNSTSTQRWWFPRNTNSIAFTDPYSLPISVKRLVRQMLKQPLLSIEGYIGMQ